MINKEENMRQTKTETCQKQHVDHRVKAIKMDVYHKFKTMFFWNALLLAGFFLGGGGVGDHKFKPSKEHVARNNGRGGWYGRSSKEKGAPAFENWNYITVTLQLHYSYITVIFRN